MVKKETKETEQISMHYHDCSCGCRRFLATASEGKIIGLVCSRCKKVELI